MHPIAKSAIKQILPKSAIFHLQRGLRNFDTITARKIFRRSSKTPAWLTLDELEKLHKQYPPAPEYGYDSETLKMRGKQRARDIQRLIGRKKSCYSDFLELACCDGMVSCAFELEGKNATATDIQSGGFDPRAKKAGVEFLEMDASDLRFNDESFDVIFSYAAFEHFSDPEKVLQEAIRVVRQGGLIYLNFGPLYMSPFGLHFYRSIPVPYCQLLFSTDTINIYSEKIGIDPPDFGSLNYWTLMDYRSLWNRYSHKLKRLRYYEHLNVSHLDLVSRYPFCFRSMTDNFDDLIVAEIEVLFVRI
jgi:SAM-dependent methyltransferase